MRFMTSLVLVLLIAMAILTGYLRAEQWLVLILGTLFTAAYINSKRQMWQKLCRKRDLKFYLSVLALYCAETAIAFMLYWVGRGLSTQFFKL